jgi:murein L,D-transpeptidase YcbB/YkuD
LEETEGLRRRTGQHRTIWFGAVSLLLVLGLGGCHKRRRTISAPNSTEYADNIQALVRTPRLSILRWPNYSDYRAAVETFYDDRNYEIAWVRDGRPTAESAAFVQAFKDAGAKGLNPEDYDASRWAARESYLGQIARTRDDSEAAQNAIAEYDTAMTICVMRYISDLRTGRVNPQHFNFDIDVAKKKYDLAEFVSDNAVDAKDVPRLIRSVEPDSDLYRATEQALGRYLQLASEQEAAHEPKLPAVGKHGVTAGGAYPATGELMARLELEGDAPGAFPYRTSPMAAPSGPGAEVRPAGRFGHTTMSRARKLFHRGRTIAVEPEGGRNAPAYSPPALPPVYSAELAAAVKMYQHRHGLMEDGRLTAETVASLNVPLTERVIQLQNSLERWRWLPNEYVNAPLMVNLPEFVLRGYTSDHQPAFHMRVVVGKVVGDHETPVFVHMMRYLVFRPYWNVPQDIVEKELVPHLNHGIEYLSSHNFETTDNKGKLVQATADQVEHGRVMVRERPGPKNSLGLVKFMFPNQYDIYLHSTPAPELFNRTRRDFSHGCIRVQDPESLAVWVLDASDTPGPHGEPWDKTAVQDAMMDGPDNHQVNLKRPLPIVIFYLTAIESEDGHTHFFDDIYGYDQQLQQVLAKGPPYPVKPDPQAPRPKPNDTASVHLRGPGSRKAS